ncbi:TetR/AcrR family transcriptional regulator [Aurantimonas sp. VKM B-3413]|uniref:TetR/AcrR family transcriptional regulator n=1 Tax=Aurantimonas sp. VKM B-3413 TaxID=2779401 RepID=UPI001E4B0786|nr:TetR/AcrR family transcriptional regulator [Aurantimonas sp. VKM B-3413]MCB8836368.1 TetR/AcrR family transcriptional regulator [Aurantimonas sp. VKM B-3413]
MARPRASDYDDKRQAIHRAAAEILSWENGRASMARIAEACGISKALLYHYYKDRNALIFDILHEHLQDIDASLAKAEAGLCGEARLRALSRRLLELYEDADDLHRLQLGSLDALPEADAKRIRLVERAILTRFQDALIALEPRLSTDRARLTAVSMSLLGMLNWVFTWFRPDRGLSRQDYADFATRTALAGLRDDLVPGAESSQS